MSRRARVVAAALSAALYAAPASAHLVSTGLGPVYDGMAHFLSSPEELLTMASLALLAGLRGPAQARAVVFVLPLSWLPVCLFAHAQLGAWSAIGLSLLMLTAGVLLAANAKLSLPLAGVVAVGFGAALGLFYQSADSDGVTDLAPALGAASCGFVLLALLASISLPLQRAAAKIAVRVLGSWIGALGLLMSGWFIHGHC